MSDPFTYDVFLCHSSHDKPVVTKLAERLRAKGVRVWLDDWVLQPGDRITPKIEEGLRQSRCGLFAISKASMQLPYLGVLLKDHQDVAELT